MDQQPGGRIITIGGGVSVGGFGLNIPVFVSLSTGSITEQKGYVNFSFGLNNSALPIDFFVESIILQPGRTEVDIAGWGFSQSVSDGVIAGVVYNSNREVIGVLTGVKTDIDITYVAAGYTWVFDQVRVSGESMWESEMGQIPRCFAPGTLIWMADGSLKAIENVKTVERVLAFDANHAGGRGEIVKSEVTRLFTNVTDQWIVLSAARTCEADAARNGFTELTVTPGHRFLTSGGVFRKIDDILRDNEQIVLADGSLISVSGERVLYGAETAHLYEEAETVVYYSDGAVSLAPEVR